jgi:antitoxin VapB
MALSIKHPEADRLARALAAQTGENITDAIIVALRERLARTRRHRRGLPLSAALLDIGRRCAQLPVVDDRPPDEILGYDTQGAPR